VKQTKPRVGRRIIQGLEEFAQALENGNGSIAERFNCRVVELDLHPSRYGADEVKYTRGLLGASQAIFARLLGVSVQTVRSWEQGINVPKDVACRFMDEIRLNPKYWLKRLKESTVVKH
jgi:DNA-binding transcriptional regulator YiaG